MNEKALIKGEKTREGVRALAEGGNERKGVRAV